MDEEEEMSKKRYQVKAVCPNCACGSVSDMSMEEIKAKTIDGENLEDQLPRVHGSTQGKYQVSLS